jgi:hypothetical protein
MAACWDGGSSSSSLGRTVVVVVVLLYSTVSHSLGRALLVEEVKVPRHL